MITSHEDALKKLMPIELGSVSDRDMAAEGESLDQAMTAVWRILPEAFPSSTEVLLARWEAEYGIFPRPNDSNANRRAALQARYVDIGNLSKTYFTMIAAALGYDVEITEGGELHKLFRAGISRAGESVYEAGAMWVWTVTTQNKDVGQELIDTFNDLNPPHMRLQFAYVQQ